MRARAEVGVLRELSRGKVRVQVEASAPEQERRPPAGGEAPWLDFRDRLRAFVARRVSNPADVDDIVQWAFLQLHRSLGTIRNGEVIHAWLYRTARRAIADYYRSSRRRREVPSGGVLDLDTLVAPEEAEERDASAEVAACLAPVLNGLAPLDKEAIVMTEIDGLRLKDAAGRAGLSLSGMKSRVQRARSRLREAMLTCCHLALDARGTPMQCEKRVPDDPCCDKRSPRP